jgi:hypothetical protein
VRYFNETSYAGPNDANVEKIFQILIRDDGCLPTNLPPLLEPRIEALRRLHPEATYNLLDARDIRSFLSAHFSTDVIEAYDKLAPYAYKCDLARFCLLLVHGGLYVDVGALLTARLERPRRAKLVAFRDLWLPHNCWALSTAIFFADPGRQELRTAIDLIVQNCRNRYYGAWSIDPTGPVLFGRAVALCNNVIDYWFGEARYLHRFGLGDLLRDWMGKAQKPGKHVYVLPDGRVVGVRKPAAGGDLRIFGLTGTNNYNDFWFSRRVYGEGKSVWAFSDPFVHTGPAAEKRQDGIWLTPGANGVAIFGPRINLPAGRYLVTLCFDAGARLGSSIIEVYAKNEARILKVLKPGEYGFDEQGCVRFAFESSSALKNFGVRLHTEGDCEGRFLGLEIVPEEQGDPHC